MWFVISTNRDHQTGSPLTITTLENSVHDYDRDQYIRNCRYDMEYGKVGDTSSGDTPRWRNEIPCTILR